MPCLNELAQAANYYGFLAADARAQPYTICPEQPSVTAEEIGALGAAGPAFARAVELRELGIDNWALAEWNMATARLKRTSNCSRLQHWPCNCSGTDRAIFALGNSGDLRWYEWRFPLLWQQPVMQAAGRASAGPGLGAGGDAV